MKNKIASLFLIVLIFVSSGCFSYTKPENAGETDIAAQLYELKDTYLEDAPEVRSVIALANNTKYSDYTIELKTDSKPYSLNIDFTVDSRANHRYIDENELNRMSALVFALVKDLDEIRYKFYDAYSDKKNPDSSFYGSYYTKGNLCERMLSSDITVDVILKSTENIDSFREYYKTVMSTEIKAPDRSFTDKVYELIGDDCEIVVNSGIGGEFELDEYKASDFSVISDTLPLEIGKYQGAGIKAHLILYDIRNFKTDEIKNCMFLYYIHPDEGVIVIESGIVDRPRYNKILKQIMKAQTSFGK